MENTRNSNPRAKKLYANFRDKRLKLNEEWLQKTDGSWSLRHWDVMGQKNLLQPKKVEPMWPQIERVPPYPIPENMKLRNARSEVSDARLEPTEFWRFENKGWNICEFIHGIYQNTGKKLTQHFPIHQILTNVDDSDSDNENITKNDAKERRKNF